MEDEAGYFSVRRGVRAIVAHHLRGLVSDLERDGAEFLRQLRRPDAAMHELRHSVRQLVKGVVEAGQVGEPQGPGSEGRQDPLGRSPPIRVGRQRRCGVNDRRPLRPRRRRRAVARCHVEGSHSRRSAVSCGRASDRGAACRAAGAAAEPAAAAQPAGAAVGGRRLLPGGRLRLLLGGRLHCLGRLLLIDGRGGAMAALPGALPSGRGGGVRAGRAGCCRDGGATVSCRAALLLPQRRTALAAAATCRAGWLLPRWLMPRRRAAATCRAGWLLPRWLMPPRRWLLGRCRARWMRGRAEGARRSLRGGRRNRHGRRARQPRRRHGSAIIAATLITAGSNFDSHVSLVGTRGSRGARGSRA